MEKADLKGKRLVGIDLGLKRVGLAVSDELHITTNPRKVVFYDNPKMMDEIIDFIKSEKAGAVILGYPYQHDDQETEMTKAVDEFHAELKEIIDIPVILHDESYSSKNAMQTMIAIGKKKKKRAQKGMKDMIAAALILKDYIETHQA